MEAAPRSPEKDTSSICGILHFAGVNMAKTAAGRATKVKNKAIVIDGKKIEGICDGKASSPSRKKMNICISPVIPSKK
jgi:hypothetical protein